MAPGAFHCDTVRQGRGQGTPRGQTPYLGQQPEGEEERDVHGPAE